MRFDNLKLAKKQGAAFGVILLIMTGASLFSLIKMSDVQDEIGQLNAKRLPGLSTLSEIRVDIAEYCMQQLQHSSDDYGGTQAKANKIRADLERYESLMISQEERDLYAVLQEKWGVYLNLHSQMKSLLRDNKDGNEEGNRQNLSKSYKDIADVLDQLIRISRKGFFEAAIRSRDTYNATKNITLLILGLTLLLSALIALVLVRTVTAPVRELEAAARRVTAGDYSVHLTVRSRDEIGCLSESFNLMTDSLRKAKEENEARDWFKTGQNELNRAMQGDQDEQSLARNVIGCLAKYLGAQVGVLYLFDEKNTELRLTGSYAFTKRKGLGDVIHIGEGIAGQAAFEKELISVTDIPSDYLRISSALGDTAPRNITALPFLYEGRLLGVIELGSFREFDDRVIAFLADSAENIAVGFNSALADRKIKYLLQESRQQAEELQTQQEELKAANEELTAQAEALKISETRLIEQQEELQATNDELEQKARFLAKQKAEIAEKNRHLEASQLAVRQKADALESAGKYKSEFLANMSHELRTPLNSMLILARGLADNESGNLSEDETQAAKIIYKGGNDLLKLINEILDLSKIEAGKMSINIDAVPLAGLVENVRTGFERMADEKGLKLECRTDDTLPETIQTDQLRLEQIIRNFMSNAVKFTEKGSVTFSVQQPESDLFQITAGQQNIIAISVSDTGIGIPKDKQSDIFEAFQQADGGTARKYGGTGLGLAISRELARLLGGEIRLKSEPGKGSIFTLCLPIAPGAGNPGRINPVSSVSEAADPNVASAVMPQVPDDRDSLGKEDKVILIIEDDPNFAKILLNRCHEKNFKGLISASGEEGLTLAEKHRPEAVILDIRLPGMDGWAVLDRLKANPDTRHIPVHLMSAENASPDALKKGAVGFLTKPVQKEELDAAFRKLETFIAKEIKDLLIVEDDENMRKSIRQLIAAGQDVNITEAGTGKEAFGALRNRTFDCMVLDLGLPDMTGFELLDRLEQDKTVSIPPVIVYTARELSAEEDEQLRRYSETIIVKGVRSQDRLLDETSLFLHRMVSNMPQEKRKIIARLSDKDSMFRDKKILLADDDMRNVFALSKILRERGMKVLKAEDGTKALSLLDNYPETDLVLMDIMMPVMDGYEAMKKIREQNRFRKLPVIALTAKAMQGDRAKCIAAGASDYLTKPVDTERLLSMMRVWLSR